MKLRGADFDRSRFSVWSRSGASSRDLRSLARSASCAHHVSIGRGVPDQGFRDRYGDLQSPSRGFSQGNVGAETIDNGLNDGKAEARAVFIAAQHAMERVEDELAVLRADAGACVLHPERRAIRVDLNREIDSAALRGVADRVVDEVSHEHSQVDLARPHYNIFLTEKPHVESLRFRQGHQVLERFSQHAQKAYRLRLAWLILRPSERKQLIEQAPGPENAPA